MTENTFKPRLGVHDEGPRTVLRVFISSPGDVAEERVIAQRVIHRLNARFAPRVSLTPVMWEDEPLRASATPQANITEASACDVVVCVLWSRLGTPLPKHMARPDGSVYGSGTEYEFETALEVWRRTGRPHILVYRKTVEAHISLGDRDEVIESLDQKTRLDAFFRRWFVNADGSALGAYHKFENANNFEEQFEGHLLRLAEQEAGDADATVKAEMAQWAGNPYRGLERFEAEHAPIFYGRTRHVSEILTRLRERSATGRRSLCVVGASGSGKSSVVRAGVLPMMVEPDVVVAGEPDWNVVTLTPGERPFGALAQAMSEAGLSGGFAGPVEIAHAVSAFLERSEQDRQLAVFVDQLEEVFTQTGDDTEEYRRFVETLDRLSHDDDVWLLSTIRGDFADRLARDPVLAGLFGESALAQLGLPDQRDLSQMIRRPALAAGLSFERDLESDFGLDESILQAAVAAPESLPLLQYCLSELYERRDVENRLITFAAYNAIGGLDGAIGRRAEDEFMSLAPNARDRFGAIMRVLVEVGTTSDAAARNTALKDLLFVDPLDDVFVHAFLQARLLASDHDEQGRATIWVTHEALFHTWPRLAIWIEQNRSTMVARHRLEQGAQAWASSDMESERLLVQGSPLVEAETLLTNFGDAIDDQTRRFVAASRSRANRNRRRRAFAGAAAIIGLIVVAGLSGLWAVRESRQSEQLAHANEKIQRAASLADERLQNLFTAEAIDAQSSGDVQSTAVLLEAVASLDVGEPSVLEATLLSYAESQLSRILSRLPAHPEMVTASAFSRNGREYLTGDEKGTMRVWDITTAELIRSFQGHTSAIRAIATAGDGRRILTAGDDAAVRIWRDGAFTQESEWFGVGSSVVSIDPLDPAANEFVLTGFNGIVGIWSAASGQIESSTHNLNLTPSGATALSADGSHVAIGSMNGEVVVLDLDRSGDERPSRAVLGTGRLSHVGFSPDSSSVLAIDSAGQASVWPFDDDEDADAEPWVFDAGQSILSAHWVADDLHLLLQDGSMVRAPIGDVNSAAQTVPVLRDDPRRVIAAQFDHEAAYVASVTEAGQFVITEADTGFEAFTLLVEPTASAQLNVAQNGDRMAMTAADGETVILRAFDARMSDLQRSRAVRVFETNQSVRLLLTGDQTGTARLFDLDSGALRQQWKHTDKGWISDVSFSPDGARVLVIGGGVASVYDTTTGERLAELSPENSKDAFAYGAITDNSYDIILARVPDPAGRNTNSRRSWALRPADDYSVVAAESAGLGDFFDIAPKHDQHYVFAVGSFGLKHYWQANAQFRGRFNFDNTVAWAIAPSGDIVALGNASGAVAITRHTSDHVLDIPGDGSGVRSLVFSSDSERLLILRENGTVAIGSIDERSEYRFQPIEGADVRSGIFTVNNAAIALGLNDGRVVLVDAQTGRQIRELARRPTAVEAMTFDARAPQIIALDAHGALSTIPLRRLDADPAANVAALVAERAPIPKPSDVTRLAQLRIAGESASGMARETRARNFALAGRLERSLAAAQGDDPTLAALVEVDLHNHLWSRYDQTDRVEELAFDQGRNRLAVGSWDDTLHLIDLTTREVDATVQLDATPQPKAFLGGGATVLYNVLGGANRNAYDTHVASADTGETLQSFPGENNPVVRADGGLVVLSQEVRTASGKARFRPVLEDGLLGEIQAELPIPIGHKFRVSPDLSWAATFKLDEGAVFYHLDSTSDEAKPTFDLADVTLSESVSEGDVIGPGTVADALGVREIQFDAFGRLALARPRDALSGLLLIDLVARTARTIDVQARFDIVPCTGAQSDSDGRFAVETAEGLALVRASGEVVPIRTHGPGRLQMGCVDNGAWITTASGEVRSFDISSGALDDVFRGVDVEWTTTPLLVGEDMMVVGTGDGGVHAYRRGVPAPRDTMWSTSWQPGGFVNCMGGDTVVVYGRTGLAPLDTDADAGSLPDIDEVSQVDAILCQDDDIVLVANEAGVKRVSLAEPAPEAASEGELQEQGEIDVSFLANADDGVVEDAEMAARRAAAADIDFGDNSSDYAANDSFDDPFFMPEPDDPPAAVLDVAFAKVDGAPSLIRLTEEGLSVRHGDLVAEEGDEEIVYAPRPIKAGRILATANGRALIATRESLFSAPLSGGWRWRAIETGLRRSLYTAQVEVTADGSYAAAYFPGDRSIQLITLSGEVGLHESPGHIGSVSDIAISQRDLRVASVSTGGDIIEWTPQDGFAQYAPLEGEDFLSITYSEDGRLLYVGTRTGKIIVFDRTTRGSVYSYTPINDEPIQGIDVVPGRDQLLWWSSRSVGVKHTTATPSAAEVAAR